MSKRIVFSLAVTVLALASFAAPATAVHEDVIPEPIRKGNLHIKLEQVASGMTAPLWGTNAPIHRNRLYVVDQAGLLWRVNLRTGSKRVFLDVSDLLVPLGAFGPGTFDERGFLGLAFHPRYRSNGLLYTYASEPATEPADFSTMPRGVEPDHQNVIREWRVPDPTDPSSVVDPNSSRVLLRIDHPQFNHNGGALNFGPDEMLYVSVGDGGNADDQGVGHGRRGNAQRRSNPLGDILRIDPRGTNSANGRYGIPRDNPFVAVEGVLPEIYAWGFRNPWRISFDSATGRLWAADVGQNDIEEVDVVRAGQNYGWRIKEGTFRFNPNGDEDGFTTVNRPGTPARLTDPVAQYDHDEGVAVVGGFVYRGREIASLRGRYVFGDFAQTFNNDGRLFFLRRDNTIREFRYIGREALGFSLLGFGRDASGELYALVNSTGTPFGDTGLVLRLDHELDALLTGENEIDAATGEPGAGDPNGEGSAHISLNRAAGRVCFVLAWSDIGRPVAAHIHEGAADVNGPVVVDLLANADRFRHRAGRGRASGCTEDVARALIDAIRRDPSGFYVNIHTAAFPAGAIRGELS
jgi:glucose/arabinose dehydrogenase